jgi:hypothetical protein
VSRPSLGPTQTYIQGVPAALSLGIKWPEHEADHSRPSSTKFKNAWSYTSTPTIRLHGLVLSQSMGTTSPLRYDVKIKIGFIRLSMGSNGSEPSGSVEVGQLSKCNTVRREVVNEMGRM